MRSSSRAATAGGHRRRRARPAPPALLLLSMLTVLFGGLLTGPGPLASSSPPVHASAGAETRISSPGADPVSTVATRVAAGEHTIAAPGPERGERPDAAVVAGVSLASWVHGLSSTLPDQAPTLGVTVATARLPGATRHVHAALTDHDPSRAPPRA